MRNYISHLYNQVTFDRICDIETLKTNLYKRFSVQSMPQQLMIRVDGDELYWHLVDTCNVQFLTYLHEKNVRVLWDLGMIHVNGRLLRINMQKVRDDCGDAEFYERISRGNAWAMRKICPVAHEDEDAAGIGAQCGLYVLFFGSAWKSRSPLFSNKACLSKWGPRLRTWDAWLALLQRRVKAWLNARKSLAIAMSLHARLGKGSAVAGLGADLLGKVCSFL